VEEGKDDDALRLIENTKGHALRQLSELVHRSEEDARIGIAFHQKDYDEFLRLAQQVAKELPQSSEAAGQVASAYACKYAVTGDPTFRQAALDKLDEARKLSGPADKSFAEYENRIQHRLATRTVITHAQFVQQFPNGWKGN
jgi:hypothetical protein